MEQVNSTPINSTKLKILKMTKKSEILPCGCKTYQVKSKSYITEMCKACKVELQKEL